MNSPRSSRERNQEVKSDVDPVIYKLFQKMMSKMASEQAEANPKKVSPQSKIRGKPVKIGRKKVQHDSASELAEEDSEEEQSAFFQNPLYRPKKIIKEPESASKTNFQIPVEDPIHQQVRKMIRMVKDLQARDKNKRVYTCKDFYDGLKGDDNLEDLPRKFIKFDGTGNPKAHLAMFFTECNRFKRNNRALFICFLRSLEGIAAKWYAEHINPIELRDFDKVVNLFIKRFLFNVEALPTLNQPFNLRQTDNEKARDFIHRWRSTYNKMRDPISEGHTLSIILNNFSQPLKGLISTSPS
jgi:hypothetical protein